MMLGYVKVKHIQSGAMKSKLLQHHKPGTYYHIINMLMNFSSKQVDRDKN